MTFPRSHSMYVTHWGLNTVSQWLKRTFWSINLKLKLLFGKPYGKALLFFNILLSRRSLLTLPTWWAMRTHCLYAGSVCNKCRSTYKGKEWLWTSLRNWRERLQSCPTEFHNGASHFHESDVVLAVAVQLPASLGEALLEYCPTCYLIPKLLHLCKCAISLEE